MHFLHPFMLLGTATALPQPQTHQLTTGVTIGGQDVANRLKELLGDFDGDEDEFAELVEEMEEGAAESWQSDEAGANTLIGISEARIEWGDQKPWEVVEQLLSACHFNACPPDTKVTQEGRFIPSGGGVSKKGDIVVRADGTFEKGNDDASLSSLVDVAVLAFKEFSEEETRTSRGINSCTQNGQCTTVGQETLTQYSSVRAVTITVHDEDRGLEGTLGISISVEQGSTAEECADVTGTADSIAGILGSWSTPLSLASLVCSAIAEQ